MTIPDSGISTASELMLHGLRFERGPNSSAEANGGVKRYDRGSVFPGPFRLDRWHFSANYRLPGAGKRAASVPGWFPADALKRD